MFCICKPSNAPHTPGTTTQRLALTVSEPDILLSKGVASSMSPSARENPIPYHVAYMSSSSMWSPRMSWRVRGWVPYACMAEVHSACAASTFRVHTLRDRFRVCSWVRFCVCSWGTDPKFSTTPFMIWKCDCSASRVTCRALPPVICERLFWLKVKYATTGW